MICAVYLFSFYLQTKFIALINLEMGRAFSHSFLFRDANDQC